MPAIDLENTKLSPATQRKKKSDAALKSTGGSINHIRLSAKPTAILLALAREHGGKTQALEWLLLEHEKSDCLENLC